MSLALATVMTIDAMGCQRAIAEKIVAKKADYILAVKDNQGHLLEEMKDSFRMLEAALAAEEIDCGHGRVERRTCAVIADTSLAGQAAQNFSLLNRIALNLLKQESTSKHGIKGKRPKAGWDHGHLLKLLGI